MKARWDFFFECHGLRFDGIRRFRGTLPPALQPAAGPSTFDMRFEPDAELRFPGADQTGVLRILIPGRSETTRDFAVLMASRIAHQISFHHRGRLMIHGGLIVGEHLPETPEEAAALGENPCFAEAHVEEVLPPTPFDAAALRSIINDPAVTLAIQQYNASTQALNPIDQFLGIVKVLEDQYCSRKWGNLEAALKESSELRDIARQQLLVRSNGQERPFDDTDIDRLIKDIATARHECAHLRSSVGLGISHGDHRVRQIVAPLIDLVSCLAHFALQRRVNEAHGKGNDVAASTGT